MICISYSSCTTPYSNVTQFKWTFQSIKCLREERLFMLWCMEYIRPLVQLSMVTTYNSLVVILWKQYITVLHSGSTSQNYLSNGSVSLYGELCEVNLKRVSLKTLHSCFTSLPWRSTKILSLKFERNVFWI